MARQQGTSKSSCALCDLELPKSSIGRHLATCPAWKPGGGKCFHLLVEGRYDKAYWMHLAVWQNVQLVDLDAFLRRAWLECCGHLSQFAIGGLRYSMGPSEWPDEGERTMQAPLGELLRPGLKFTYAYDFGSTTKLQLKVLGEKERSADLLPIQLLALNSPPVYPCASCDQTAAFVNVEGGPDDSFLCDSCAKQACDPEMTLPLVNSPRAGVCGYTGPTIRMPAPGLDHG